MIYYTAAAIFVLTIGIFTGIFRVVQRMFSFKYLCLRVFDSVVTLINNVMRTFHQFLSEISQEDITKIGKQINVYSKNELEDLPFNDIFENKARIVLPMLDTQEKEFKKNLERLGYKVDLKKGVVTSDVETEQGVTKRVQKIGRAIQRIIKNNPRDIDFWKEQAHWWEKNSSNIGRIGKTGVSIIVSRHPIDIIRMSDHKEFSSCHSPGASYFKCAIQEAKTGGAVAYIVRNSDLDKIGKNLQAKDIFKDSDRDVKGIEPLERIRLRRFSDGKKNLLVPELRTYGIKHVGFYDAIKDWALDVQGIDSRNPPDLKKFELHGGSYQDNVASEIWNSFLGTKIYHLGKSSVDQSGEGGKDMDADAMHDQAQRQLDEHRANWEHYDASFEVGGEDGESLVIWFNGYVQFSFPESEFVQELTDKDLGYNDGLGKLIRSNVDIWTIEDISLNNYEDDVIIQLSIGHEPDGYAQGPLDEFESFLDSIDNFDRDYDEHYQQIYNMLVEEGFLRNWVKEDLSMKNIEIDVDERKGDVSASGKFIIGDLMGLSKEKIKEIFGDVSSYRSASFSPVAQQFALNVFPNFKFIKPENIFFKVNDDYIHGYLSNNDSVINKPIKVDMHIDIDLPYDPVARRKYIVALNYLDKNWNYVQRRGADFWDKVTYSIKAREEPDFSMSKFQPPKIKKPEFRQLEFPFNDPDEGQEEDIVKPPQQQQKPQQQQQPITTRQEGFRHFLRTHLRG